MTPLGMENHEISDSSITASSEASAIEAKTYNKVLELNSEFFKSSILMLLLIFPLNYKEERGTPQIP